MNVQTSLQTLKRLGVVALAGLSLSACVAVSNQPDGSTTIIGAAAVTVKPVAGSPPPHIRVQSLGVTISDNAPDSGVVLGYSDRSFQNPYAKPQAGGYSSNIDFVGMTAARDGYSETRLTQRHGKRVKKKWRKRCRCR
jgi:hypothetical protein